MSTRATLTWVIVAIVLVAGYWYTGRMAVEQRRTLIEAKRFLDVDPASIDRIGISTREHELIEAQRIGEGKWDMLKPFPHIPPNHAQWEQLAQSIPFLINERPIEASPADLAIYGLDNPPLKLTLEAGGEITQLNIGKLDPTQNNRYAQVGDGDVFLLPSRMAEAFYLPLNSLRDTRVFPEMEQGIDRIHVQRYADGIDEVYALGDDGEWRMVEPLNATVFQNEVLYLVNDLTFLQGDGYVDDPQDLGDFGLDPDTAWARIVISNSETGVNRAMILGWLDEMADDGRMFAAVQGVPSVFSIDAAFIDRLPEEAGDYRERRLFTGEATQLKSIQYQDRNRTFTLENDETRGWTLTDPPHDDTDNLLVSRFISIMKQFSGKRFPDADETEFGEERIRYDFEYMDGSKSHFAILDAVPDSEPIEFYARQDVATVITVPAEAVALFSPKPFTFRNRQVFGFDPRNWSRISITLDGLRRTLVLDDGKLSVTEPPNYGVASNSALGIVLTTLPSLVALDVQVGEIDDAVTGFSNPTLEAEVEWVDASGTTQMKRLTIGALTAESSHRRFARVSGRPEVFHVEQGYISDLREGLKGIAPQR